MEPCRRPFLKAYLKTLCEALRKKLVGDAHGLLALRPLEYQALAKRARSSLANCFSSISDLELNSSSVFCGKPNIS